MSLKTFLSIAAITYGALFACGAPPEDVTVPTTSTSFTTTSTSKAPAPTSTSSTTTSTTEPPTPIVFPDTPCQEWAPLAVEAGWPPDPLMLDRLLKIMWRESRCTPTATSRDDDRGLLQIHTGSWCRPNRYNVIGWLQAQGIIDSCLDLYDPLENLQAARAIWLYSEARGDAWRPWALTR